MQQTTDVSVDQNSIITFKLDSYDNSSGEIKSYDASKMKFILDFTQTLGELDKTAALIGENITYTARQGGNSTVTGKYETGSYTIELNNVKIPTEINITESTIALNAGGEADVGATLTQLKMEKSKVLKKVTPQLQFHLLVMIDMQQQKIKQSLLLLT